MCTFCEDGFIGHGYYIMCLTLVYGDLGFCICFVYNFGFLLLVIISGAGLLHKVLLSLMLHLRSSGISIYAFGMGLQSF